MPDKARTTLLPTEVALHNSKESCYVAIGSRIYDITGFLKDHPGGGDLILEHGGKDISEIMHDEASHTHSGFAYKVLKDFLIGHYPVTKAHKRLFESSDSWSLTVMPPGYRETSIDSRVDPLTFIKPRTGLLEDKRLALGQRRVAGSGQAYYLDPLRFMHAKGKTSARIHSASLPTYGDAHYVEQIHNGTKPPSDPLSDRRLWYRVVLRLSFAFKSLGESLAEAIDHVYSAYGYALALLFVVLVFDSIDYESVLSRK